MEGKALLYKYLGGVDAWPIILNTKDPDKIIDTILTIQPALGGVNLEDFAQPKCFRILDTLREKVEIPIWHDDQQGTATVTLAEAKEAGAAVVATGRSDFPNQVNNSLGFPGIFRGTLGVRASTSTDEMCIAAAEEFGNASQIIRRSRDITDMMMKEGYIEETD